MKPDNICIGKYNDAEELHQLKLIDFGLATPYLQTNDHGEKVHIKKTFKTFQGNLAFSSKNAFNEVTLSRRDDLLSLVYMLIYLATGQLPFVNHNQPLLG